ncbi:hypothetical protein Tco_1567961, partial [Tanacetum coccineum]
HDQPSSSRLNELDEEPLTSTFVEDETAGGSFYEFPPRSHKATPSVGQPSRVAEDPLTLTTLSSLVSKFMQKTCRNLRLELLCGTQVSSRSVKTYTRASKGSTSVDTSFRMDFSPNAVTPGGLTHSFANQDIPADSFVPPGNMPISTGSVNISCGQ